MSRPNQTVTIGFDGKRAISKQLIELWFLIGLKFLSIDPYVKVVNNQYVLQLPENNNVSQSVVTEIEDELSQVNDDIKSNGYTIKTNDKTYGASTSAVFGVVLVKSSSSLHQIFIKSNY